MKILAIASAASFEVPKVIVNPGGTNERFDRAHLPKATIVQWSDNATIFDALIEGKADLMITDAVETRVQAKLHPDHPDTPFDRSEQSVAEPARSLGRASGNSRGMDAPSLFRA
jgi:ABC-type amino acid transport substrate-binding protein